MLCAGAFARMTCRDGVGPRVPTIVEGGAHPADAGAPSARRDHTLRIDRRHAVAVDATPRSQAQEKEEDEREARRKRERRWR